jgi:hypothetical protein
MANPLINGVNYSWGDVSVMLFGSTPLVGITSIEYDEDQEMENNYGAGNFPVGQGYGQFKYTGSIELYKEEINNIIALAPMGKIQLIPAFSIKVVYGNLSQALTVDTLQSCVFQKNPFSAKSNDKKLVMKIPLLIGNINWNNS